MGCGKICGKPVEKSKKCIRRPQISEADFLFLFSSFSGTGAGTSAVALAGTGAGTTIGITWKANDAYAF
jgi:hypothetical protein